MICVSNRNHARLRMADSAGMKFTNCVFVYIICVLCGTSPEVITIISFDYKLDLVGSGRGAGRPFMVSAN
jgi:hypothetical protein